MRRVSTILVSVFSLFLMSCTCKKQDDKVSDNDLKLWFAQPAIEWNEALPVGNGRLGAMVFGSPGTERITLNEESLWTGHPIEKNNPEAAKVLPEVREAILNKDYAKADVLSLKMQGPFTQSYAPLGDLMIEFDNAGQKTTDYYRELNLNTGIATSTYTCKDVEYKQEVFVSAADQVIIVKISGSSDGSITFQAGLKSLLKHTVSVESDNQIEMNGRCPKHADPDYMTDSKNPIIYDKENGEGMRFNAKLWVQNSGGSVKTVGNKIAVEGADEVVLMVSAGTSFNGFDKSPGLEGLDPQAIARKYMDAAKDKDYRQLLAGHLEDYKSYFDRVSFRLTNEPDTVPTGQRLKNYSTAKGDKWLEQLLFHYGRYLLISSSRPGGVPANLQGIWSHKMRPPWSDNFTNNINVQMNYWPAEVCNLSELHEPMLRFINDLEINGKKTASINYNCEGWCAHHNSDIWASTNPVGDNGSRGTGSIRWANWCMAGPWYCQHLWQHYEYTLDKNFLKDDAYPLMKGAAEFLLDWLVEGSDGTLVTIPSTSPENAFITDEGVEAAAQMASTMDMTLARELFTNLIKASEILEIDGEFRELLVKKRERLTPLKIGKYGQLQEWYYDWDRLDDKHRHISHIYGLYPGDIITTESTPELAAACEKSLEMRGDEGTGWSSAWKTCTWARLKDGNRAYKMFDYILRYVDPSNYSRGNLGGGSYPNLLGACPPFMIDGSFGISSGIAEMLMQSHAGVIQLLPAIPDNWSYGSITGLRARGGFEVDINWKDGKLTEVTVKSLKGTEMNVSYVGKKITHPTKVGDIFTFSISDFI